jgi:hypothetical protein
MKVTDQFDWTRRPKRVKEAAFRVLDGEAVVVLSNRAEIKVLSEVGARIWQLCDGKSTAREISRTIEEEFDAESSVVEADVREFLEALEERKMIEEAEPRG